MLADLSEFLQLLPEFARYLLAYAATCLDDWRDVAAYLQELVK